MTKKLCQSLGLASLILVVNYGELLGGGTDTRMHSPLPLTSVCLAQVTDILLLSLGIFLILATLKRMCFYPWLRFLLASFIPSYLIVRTQSAFPFHLRDGIVPLVAIAWTLLLLLFRLSFPQRYLKAMDLASEIGVFFALFAVCSIVQLLWVARWKPGPQQRAVSWMKAPQPPRLHSLLVWIIFDELCLGNVRDVSRNEFRRIIGTLVQQGAQAVILGCTEISMLVGTTDSAVPVFDTTSIHATKAAEWAMSEQ